MFVVEEGSSRSLAGTMARQRGATATSRPSATALAAAASSGDGGVGGGDDADEGSSVGGVWAVQDEDEWEFEEEVQRLEERLEAAVKHEDYKGASKCRDELYRFVGRVFSFYIAGSWMAWYSSNSHPKTTQENPALFGLNQRCMFSCSCASMR